MLNIKINFTEEEKNFIRNLDSKNIDYVSPDEVIRSQNSVFNALTGRNIDYSKATVEDTVELFRTALAMDSDSEIAHDLDEENYKDNLEKLALKFINQEKCHGTPTLMSVKDGQAVRYDFSEIDKPEQEMTPPSKPNWFKRLIHSLFGGFKEDFDRYNTEKQAYDDYVENQNFISNFREKENKFFDAYSKEFDNLLENGMNVEDLKYSFDKKDDFLEMPVEDIKIGAEEKDDFEKLGKSFDDVLGRAANMKNDELDKLISELDDVEPIGESGEGNDLSDEEIEDIKQAAGNNALNESSINNVYEKEDFSNKEIEEMLSEIEKGIGEKSDGLDKYEKDDIMKEVAAMKNDEVEKLLNEFSKVDESSIEKVEESFVNEEIDFNQLLDKPEKIANNYEKPSFDISNEKNFNGLGK